MDLLSTTEQILLLAVMALGDEAYGVTIKDHVTRTTGRVLSVGATYTSLERLVGSGLLTSRIGEPTAARGGRAKRFYEVTAEGARALEETRSATSAMWSAAHLGTTIASA